LKVSAEPALRRRVAVEFDQPNLVRVQRQRELPPPFAHCVQEVPGIGLVLEADYDVTAIAKAGICCVWVSTARAAVSIPLRPIRASALLDAVSRPAIFG
jgi:hypothetical protein